MFIDTIRNLFIFKEYNFISLMKIYRNVNQHLTESLAEIPIPLVYIYTSHIHIDLLS